jgi:hypothetical protein
VRIEQGEGAYRAADFAERYSFARAPQAFPIPAHLVVPKRERQSKRSGLGVNAVRAANLRRLFEFKRALLQHFKKRLNFLKENVAGFPEQQGVRSVDNVGRGQAIVNKARGLANVFGQIGGKGDDVGVGCFLNFIYALDGKLGARFDLLDCVARNGHHLGVHFADSNLHVQPLLEFALLAPERAHFR